MLVATRHDGSLVHARFLDLPRFLSPGDLLVVNTSATLPAALDARHGDRVVELRLSTPAEAGTWIVELRTEAGLPLRAPPVGARLELPGGAHAVLLARYAGSDRLSVARLELAEPLERYLSRHGRAIRYDYVPERWPLAAYQTVFALEPGSAEMPSAGRPFTPQEARVGATVATVGFDVADKLFPGVDPIGKSITVQGIVAFATLDRREVFEPAFATHAGMSPRDFERDRARPQGPAPGPSRSSRSGPGHGQRWARVRRAHSQPGWSRHVDPRHLRSAQPARGRGRHHR
jgi:hypothetical protein